MPWYRIWADCGPGHQSHAHYYHYSTKALDKDSKRALFEHYLGDHDDAIGDVDEVELIPELEKESQLLRARASIKHGREMLSVLAKTKTRKLDPHDAERERRARARCNKDPSLLHIYFPKECRCKYCEARRKQEAPR